MPDVEKKRKRRSQLVRFASPRGTFFYCNFFIYFQTHLITRSRVAKTVVAWCRTITLAIMASSVSLIFQIVVRSYKFMYSLSVIVTMKKIMWIYSDSTTKITLFRRKHEKNVGALEWTPLSAPSCTKNGLNIWILVHSGS